MASFSNVEEIFTRFELAEFNYPCDRKVDSCSIWEEVQQNSIIKTQYCFAFSIEDSH